MMEETNYDSNAEAMARMREEQAIFQSTLQSALLEAQKLGQRPNEQTSVKLELTNSGKVVKSVHVYTDTTAAGLAALIRMAIDGFNALDPDYGVVNADLEERLTASADAVREARGLRAAD